MDRLVRLSPSSTLCYGSADTIAEVDRVLGLYPVDELQTDGFVSKVLEEPNAITKQYWRNMQMDFIDQPRLERLLCSARSPDPYVHSFRESPRLRDGRLYAVSDEDELRPSLWRASWGLVSQDDDGYRLDRMFAAPSSGDFIGSPTCKHRSHAAERLFHNREVLCRRLEHRALVGAVSAEVPVEDMLPTTPAEWMIAIVPWTGDEPVER